MAISRMNQNISTTKYKGSRFSQPGYVKGSAAHKIDIREEIKEAPKKQLSNTARKNREKAAHMSLGYVLFLTAALIVAGYVLIGYLQTQANITTQMKQIARMESELNTLKTSNDEEYNRILNSVDIEEVKRVAIGELGMVYAAEGQIITYENTGSDFMRRVAGK